jgi:hypothetical protein
MRIETSGNQSRSGLVQGPMSLWRANQTYLVHQRGLSDSVWESKERVSVLETCEVFWGLVSTFRTYPESPRMITLSKTFLRELIVL